MERTVARGVRCALICFASLAIALPAAAQSAAAPSTTTKSVSSGHAGHAAKPAAHAAKKPVRWGPRRYYSRWHPYSRWGWHSAWHKPAVAAKPAAKAPVKPAWSKPAGSVAGKPASASWHAKPVSAAHAVPAYGAKPSPWSKPAAKQAAKPAGWAKPAAAAKPAAWAKVKPAAKTLAQPPAKSAAPKTAAKAVAEFAPAAAVAKKIDQSPENMTRDANNGTQSIASDSPIAGGDHVDIMGQVGRMVGALVFVLLLISGVVFLLRRYKLVPVAETGAAMATAQPIKPNASKGLAAAFLPVFSNLAGAKGQLPKTTAAQDLSDALIGNGGLQIVGAQPLPGSGTIIYLVRIEDHMVLLGASYAGGVRLLAEWEKDDTSQTEEEKVAFDSFLRKQGIAVEPEREEEEHTFATIRARLNSTAERLAGLRQEFGG